MISCSSTLASSAPATSAKVTLGVSPASSFALDLPNENALLPPACIWRMMNTQIAIMRITGSQLSTTVPMEGRADSAVMFTLCSRS